MLAGKHRAGLVLSACFIASHASAVHGGSISLRQNDGIDYIMIEGEVEESDVAHFQRIAVSSDKAVVVLGSPGGALTPALEIGKIIRLKGFGTYVPKGAECTSACALIWIAGQPRMLSQTSKIGFHASYTLDGGQQMESGLGNAMVGRYLTLLNLPERAVIFATSAAPNSMAWVDPRNSQISGIEFQLVQGGSGEEPTSVSASAGPAQPIIASRDYSWRGSNWSVLSSSDREGCFAVAEFASENNQNNSSSVSISKDRHKSTGILSFSNERFKSVKEGETYKLEIFFVTGETIDEGWGEKDFVGLEYDDGTRGLAIGLDWDELVSDFRAEEKIAFFRGETLVDVFPLQGSANAIRELQKCLGSNVNGAGLSDPFG